MKIRVKRINSADELRQAQAIRRTVFVVGQGIAVEEEIDQYENSATHILALADDLPVGTARWRKTADGIKLERFAVLPQARGQQIGRALVEFCQETLGRLDLIYLNAQRDVVGFYEKYGFRTAGPEFYEVNIPHVRMEWTGSTDRPDSGESAEKLRSEKISRGLDPDNPVFLFVATSKTKSSPVEELFNEIDTLKTYPFQWILAFDETVNRDIIGRYRALASPNLKIVDSAGRNDWMPAADMLVTDNFLSCSEYLVYDRPIITFRVQPDPDIGLNISDPADFFGAIVRSLEDPDEFSASRRICLDELNWCDE